MKLLVVSDLHLDWVTHGVSRYEELHNLLLGDVLATVEKEKPDAFVFTGDLTDPDTGPVVFRAISTAILLARILEEKGVEQFWIAGNHDVIEDGTGTTTLSPLKAMESNRNELRVFERPGSALTRNGEVLFCALPFTATSHAYDPAAFLKETLDENARKTWQKTVVLSHLTVPGVQPGEEVTEMPRGREVLFPTEALEGRGVSLVIQGHYHRQQAVDLGPGLPPMWIPGSLVRLSFGEQDNRPGYLVVEV